jgi:hypothetical protein
VKVLPLMWHAGITSLLFLHLAPRFIPRRSTDNFLVPEAGERVEAAKQGPRSELDDYTQVGVLSLSPSFSPHATPHRDDSSLLGRKKRLGGEQVPSTAPAHLRAPDPRVAVLRIRRQGVPQGLWWG